MPGLEEPPPIGGGDDGGGGDRYIYEKLGKLEGQMLNTATKEDVQGIRTDFIKQIGDAKNWVLYRIIFVILAVLGLAVGSFEWVIVPSIENLIDKFFQHYANFPS